MNTNSKLKPVDPSYVPSVSLTTLPASSPLEKILEVLERDGGIILSDFVSQEELHAIDQELEPYNLPDKDFHKSVVNADLNIIATQTQLIHGLVGKSPTIANIVAENETLEKLREKILREKFCPVWEGEPEEFIIEPLLNLSIAFQMGYGAPRQKLHRDDFPHATRHEGEWDLSKEKQFTCFIAGSKITRENGGTMFIPGSHRWDDSRGGKLDECCFLEMEAGSIFIFLASAMHGAGHHSVPGDIRKIYALFFIRGYLRQEENQFLAIPRSQTLKMSDKMLALLGYKMQNGLLGSVNSRDPMANLPAVLEAANA